MGARLLVADVGGTNLRLGIADQGSGGIRLSEVSESRISAHEDLASALKAYLGAVGVAPASLRGASLSIAGPVEGGRCLQPNCGWPIDAAALEAALGLGAVTLLNDFHAAALGTLDLSPAQLVQLGGLAATKRGSRVVLGPGTGLGVATLAWAADEPVVLAGEGGHAVFAPRGAQQRALHAWLERELGRACWEDVLSGPGLVRLHRFLVERDGLGLPLSSDTPEPAAEIAHRGLSGRCPRAAETLALFAELLGGFAGALALLSLPLGGVWLAGGISARLLPALRAGGHFRTAFEDQGSRVSVVAPLPVFVVEDAHLGLRGAARYLLRPQR